jgi:hypothetical protein
MAGLRTRISVDHDGAMHGRCWSGLAALSTVLVGMTIASIADARTVVVVRPDAADAMLTEAFSRLCGELHMYGLEVKLLESADGGLPGDQQPAEVGGVADVVGGVVLSRAPGQAIARIWIAEAATPKESVRITVSIDDADAPSLVAIRAADLLRAGLRDFDRPERARLEPRSPAASGVSKAMPATGSTMPDGFERWAIRGGVGTLWETGDMGVGLAAQLGLARRVASRLALELAIAIPVTNQAYGARLATARLRQGQGMLAITWRLVGGQRLVLDVFQGLGAAFLSVRGEALSPWLAQSASAWAAASATGGCIGLRLSRHLDFNISLAAVFLLPRPVLEVADTSYTAHQPLILATGGLRYAF